MKKLTVVLTAILCCSLAYSQEVDIRIIPRVDVNTYAPINNEGSWDVDFGNTSLYTLVEGTFLENFSYSVANHWMSIYGYSSVVEDLSGLYTNTFAQNANNWLDWANITYTLGTENAGSFSFTAGKDVMAIGDYETDAYDFDSHFGLNSMFWSYAPIYQWGGKVGYTTPSEMTSLYLQATTSPFGGSLLNKDPQYGAYSLIWYGDYDWFAPIWSTNFIQYDKGNNFINVIALGNQFYVGDATLGIDYTNRARLGQGNFFNSEMSLMGTSAYNFGDKVELFGKVGWERFANDGFFSLREDDVFGLYEEYGEEIPGLDAPTYQLGKDFIFGGIGVNYYPLKDSQDLRLHAVISANNWVNEMSINFGVTYNFSVFSR